ncbi:MAG: GGDEF domain-containing protein [Oscillospiraceae bacterium]|nr:GGDEF domain-containing protein [Oscillospiraceae bacterium]
MKQFQIMRYLKKYCAIIVACSLLMGLLCYGFMQQEMQKYTASTMIEYTNPTANDGKAPDGKSINVDELRSSQVVSQAMANLGHAEYNMDSIRDAITITPLIEDEELLMQEAQLEKGIEYKIYPVRYLVEFTTGVEYGKEYARTVLNEILDVYTVYYGQNHVNEEGGTNGIDDIYSKNYDYIEMLEVIDASLENVLTLLVKKNNSTPDFRSHATGYAFSDLHREFEFIRNVEVPQLASQILSQKITIDRDVLLAKYHNRNNSLSISNTVNKEQTDYILKIIESYVLLMSGSDNTNITHEYILDELQGYYHTSQDGTYRIGVDQTTEYDELMESYIYNRNRFEDNLIDQAYNTYVLSVYENAPAVSTEKQLADTKAQIEALAAKLTGLYQILDVTNDEYNEYLGAENVAILNSVGVTERLPVGLYTAFLVLIFGVVGCVGAIFFGRVEDIIDYYAFTDKVDGLPNRAKCDRYIENKKQAMLTGDFACAALRITNLRQENERLGRKTGDEMMRTFAGVLTQIFVPSDAVFVGNNGAGQYLVFAEDMNSKQMEAAMNQLKIALASRTADMPYTIQFESGYSSIQEDQVFFVRQLLSAAMTRLNQAKNAGTKA